MTVLNSLSERRLYNGDGSVVLLCGDQWEDIFLIRVADFPLVVPGS